MSALSWLRMARRVPGLGSQPELPNLETLIESEALKPKDEYHIARWVAPLCITLVGLATFIPLTVTISTWFLFGVIGMPLIASAVGFICHLYARGITDSEIRLRKSCWKLMAKLNGLKNLLGFAPVLSPRVAEVLEEAAGLYLKVRPPANVKAPKTKGQVFAEAYERARLAMDEAMAQILTLAEGETAAAQEAELDRGWATALLDEMRAGAKAIQAHRQSALGSALVEGQLAPLAGLREARADLERLDHAVNELEQEVR